MKTWVNGVEVLESEVTDGHIYNGDLISKRVPKGQYTDRHNGKVYEYHFTTDSHNTVPPYELIEWYCNS